MGSISNRLYSLYHKILNDNELLMSSKKLFNQCGNKWIKAFDACTIPILMVESCKTSLLEEKDN